MEFEWKIVSRGPADVAELLTQECVEGETGGRSQRHQHGAFGEELADDVAAAGAERLANRQLALPGNTTRQQQAGDVQAGDQRQQGRGAEQHDEKDEEAAVVTFGGGVRCEAGHGAEHGDAAGEILAADIPGGGQQGFAALAACETVAQAAEGVTMGGIGSRDHVDFRRDAAAQDTAIIARQYAGDGVQMPIQFERAADDMGIAAKPPAPETVADHGDGAAFVGLGIEPAGRCANAKDIEEIGARDHLPGDFAVRTRIPVDIVEPDVESQILKYAGMAEFAIAGIRNLGGNARQAVRLPGAEVVKDHLAHDAVDRDIDANAQSQRRNGNSDERRRSTEASQGAAKVGQ